jgi:aspartyl-tRNA(Asn)/glutamyl-tRNA(Gln) amidotransferase subunit B
MKYEPVIGLEIHAELKTRTKMFCYSLNDPNEKHPNINVCPVCLGHPGTLPVANEEAVKKVIMVGLALHGEIPEFSQFDRKNYFYPDLPKGYQISQYHYPLVTGGYLDIFSTPPLKGDNQISNSQFLISKQTPNSKSQTRRIRITRVHLEEDTGRLVHERGPSTSSGRQATLVDFNRAGVPLMELVTEPDLHTGEEVKKFGEELQKIFRYIGASDADMEKGQMRVEVNISLREVGQEKFGTKVEIKNINSFKYAADAVDYEIERQTKVLESGASVAQETRGWNENKGESFSQRSKEEAHDYRYFPEPDLPPLHISREMVEELKALLPELPEAKRRRFIKEYGFAQDIAAILAGDKPLADYAEAVMSELRQHDKETPEEPKRKLGKVVGSYLTGEFLRLLNAASASAADTLITAENFGELMLYVAEDKISNLAAKVALEEMFRTGEDPSDIIEKKGLWQVSNIGDLENIVRHILEENQASVGDYKKGKTQALQFLVGQVMKESRGKANPKMVQETLQKILKD